MLQSMGLPCVRPSPRTARPPAPLTCPVPPLSLLVLQIGTPYPEATPNGRSMDVNMTRPDNATILMLRDPAIAVVLPVVYSLVALVSIPGNLFSLWVLCRHIGPKTPSVIFMINLILLQKEL